ncbi:MAG: glycoside hydrolase family 44 protein [Tepidisphaeraceae bacterium]
MNEPLGGPFTNLTLTRLGGNRWSAYNWLNNASNAGNDWHYQNDNYLGGGSAPGGAMIPGIENARQNHAGIILTVPMIGRLSADKNADGDPRTTPDYLQKRFRPEQPAKNSPFNLSPDPNSSVVYEDEFINWVKFHYPYGQTDPQTPIWFMLDNEPDLWAGTHAEVHPNKTTYAELIAKTIAYATAIKRVEPNAVIFGPANYGWNGFVTLQNAPDAAGRDFQTVYLQAMAAAEKQSGHRLLDVLDIHWYPSERIGKIRITSPDTTPDLDEARIQSPRSLWDPTYTESSWITRNLNAPIRLIPRLQEKIARNYPGTKLSISEYQYGGYDSISGALAQADALGTFGRQGLFAANQWPPGIPQPYTTAAFAMFRNFDAHRATFGNISIRADSENPSAASIYASLDSANPRIMILVAINKTLKPLSATAILTHAAPFTRMEIFQLTSADPHPHFVIEEKIPDPQNLRLSLPGRSVSTFRLSVGQ